MKLLAAALVAASLAICASTARAEVTETRTTTTTIESSAAPGVVLPGGVTYNIVNPSTATVVGPYQVGVSVPSGHYIIEQSTGRVLATTDASGRLVTFTNFPSVLPQRFLLIGGQMVYFNDDYAYRRAQLDQKSLMNTQRVD